MGPTAKKTTVYDEVVEVTYEYLGPAARRFVSRVVKAHIGKKPEQLTRQDLTKLHDWSKLAFATLTEDDKMVDDYGKSLMALVKARQSE